MEHRPKPFPGARQPAGRGPAIAGLAGLMALSLFISEAAAAQVRPAFPGAEGFGRLSRGGRGGRIIAVTTLANSGPGSLRACIDRVGPRVCVFRVGGVIRYTSMRPEIRNPYLTIAGETAPGGGILITHAGGKGAFTPLVIKNTHDVIVRHIRVRMDRPGEQRRANSAFTIEGSSNVILDHVSASWAQDENMGGYAQNDAITVSWSIFAEGVPRHDKCALLSSDPTGPQHISFVKNLCAHNGDRNPDVNVMPGSCVELVNNVLYNGQSQFTEVWESYGGSRVNIIGNHYRRGPNTARLTFGIDRPLVGSTGPAKIYQSDNLADGHGIVIAPAARLALVGAPVCRLATRAMPARQTFGAVLAAAGAFPRDAVDERLVYEVRSRTGAIGRPNRIIPFIAGGSPYEDGDGDGMSDKWEMAHGCDPRRSDAWNDANRNGWANLEEFLDYAHRERLAGRQPR